jgi:hypothetical protein
MASLLFYSCWIWSLKDFWNINTVFKNQWHQIGSQMIIFVVNEKYQYSPSSQ